MKHSARKRMVLGWVALIAGMLACSLGAGSQGEDLETSGVGRSTVKSTPTPGEVPIERTEPIPEPTGLPPTVQPTAPPSGGGTTASAQVLQTTTFVSADGVFHIIGVLANDGEVPIWQLVLQYQVLDQSGVEMDTITGYPSVDLILPGEIVPFGAEIVEGFPRQVGDVVVTLEGEPISYAAIEQNSFLRRITHSCDVVRIEGREPAGAGDFEIAGEVRITSDRTLDDLKISAMVFDAADNLVAASTWIVPDAYVIGQGLLLAPGETTTFDAWFGTLAEGGPPERIVVGCEGVQVESE